tara:strand:- start:1302 stop:1775 length:474 start_codon:yes stop_codon:yes gene_type:complete
MYIIEGFVSGIVATIMFDIFQYTLYYSYNINRSRWDLVGRYFIGFKNKIYIRENLENDDPIKNELIIGYLIHYLIGSIFGLIYVLINTIFFNEPSIFLAIFVGFATVIGGWCIMMPYAYNIGFFAIKKDEWKQILAQNLLVHFIFGIGLFIGYIIVN